MRAGSQLGPGQIYDSNTSMLLTSLQEHGFSAYSIGVAKDNRESLVDLIRGGLEHCDVLITSGGVSMGEKVRTIIKLCLFFCASFYLCKLLTVG